MQSSPIAKKDLKKIVFSYDFKDFKYKTSFYRAKMTKNKIGKHEILSFFQKMYQKLNGFNDLKEVSSSLYRTIAIVIMSILLGIFMSVYGSFFMNNTWLIYSGLLLIGAGIFYGLCFRVRCIKMKRDILQKTRDRILEYLSAHAALFAEKNLKWNLPNGHFEWLELEVEGKYIHTDMELIVTQGEYPHRKASEDDKIAPNLTQDHTQEHTQDIEDTFNYA